jgi:hypothetical protein
MVRYTEPQSVRERTWKFLVYQQRFGVYGRRQSACATNLVTVGLHARGVNSGANLDSERGRDEQSVQINVLDVCYRRDISVGGHCDLARRRQLFRAIHGSERGLRKRP